MLMVLILGMSTTTISCKEEKNQDTQTEVSSEENHAADKADIAMNVYQCPMDCEDGKTYDKAGSCPICAMDLKQVEGKHKHDNGETHDDHDDGHN